MQPYCLVVKCLVRDCLRLFRATTQRKIINHVRVEFINFIIKGTGHDDIGYVILHCIIQSMLTLQSPVNRGFTAWSVDCSINALMPLTYTGYIYSTIRETYCGYTTTFRCGKYTNHGLMRMVRLHVIVRLLADSCQFILCVGFKVPDYYGAFSLPVYFYDNMSKLY